MPTTRQERLQELLVREVSEILRREVKDPRIGFVTVTGARLSPDLRHARVYVTILGSEEERQAALAGLESARRFVRAALGRRLDLRIVPEVRFEIDTAIERGARIHELLRQAEREREALAQPPETQANEPDRQT